MSWFARWEQFWFARSPEAGRTLGLVRMLLGVAAILKLTGAYGLISRAVVGSVDLGLPHHVWGKGRWGFTDMPAPLFDWWPRLTLAEHRQLESIALVLAVLFFLGVGARVVGVLLGASLLWMVTFDIGAFKHNTFSLGLACLMVGLSPCADAWALEARARHALGWPPPAQRSMMPVRMLQVWVCAIYTFATLAKVNESWWGGKFFAHVIKSRKVDPPAFILELGSQPFVQMALGVSTLFLEAFLSFAFLVPQLRRAALVLGAGFHLTLEVTMDVGAYSYTMLALYALFLEKKDIDDVRALWRRLRRRAGGSAAPAHAAHETAAT